MYYHWRCTDCEQKVEVDRPISQSDVPPLDPCPVCRSTSFKKLVALTAPTVNYQRRDSCYPFKFSPGEGRKDVVFTSKAQQDSWMKRHGYMLHFDAKGRDAMVGRDQSVESRRVLPPSPRAERLAQQARWLSAEELQRFEQDPNKALVVK